MVQWGGGSALCANLAATPGCPGPLCRWKEINTNPTKGSSDLYTDMCVHTHTPRHTRNLNYLAHFGLLKTKPRAFKLRFRPQNIRKCPELWKYTYTTGRLSNMPARDSPEHSACDVVLRLLFLFWKRAFFLSSCISFPLAAALSVEVNKLFCLFCHCLLGFQMPSKYFYFHICRDHILVWF